MRGALRLVFAARFLAGDGQLVKPNQIAVVGKQGCALGIQPALGIEMRLNGLNAQIFHDVYRFDFAHRRADVEIGIHIEINAHGGAVAAGIEAESGDPILGQHGDFVAGEIHGALALGDGFFHVAAGRDGQRGRGNVYAHAFAAAGQIGEAQGIVHFGGGVIIN